MVPLARYPIKFSKQIFSNYQLGYKGHIRLIGATLGYKGHIRLLELGQGCLENMFRKYVFRKFYTEFLSTIVQKNQFSFYLLILASKILRHIEQ